MKRVLFVSKNWGYGYGMGVQYLGDAVKKGGNSVLVGMPSPTMNPVDVIIDTGYPGDTPFEQTVEFKKYAPTYLSTDFETYPLPKEFFTALEVYDGVIVHSNYEKSLYELSGATPEQLSKITVIPFPVMYDLPNLTKDNYREGSGIASDTFVIGAIGSPSIRKGFVEDAIVYLNTFATTDKRNVVLIFRPTPYPAFMEMGKQLFAMIKSLKAQSGIDLDIKVISDPEFDTIKFYNTLDAVISLHHAEGFGLHLAEASLLDKQIIATSYSGNVDFMNESTAYMVPAVPSYNTDPYAMFKPTQLWVDPILPAASQQLAVAYNDFINKTPRSNKQNYKQFYEATLTKLDKFIASNTTRSSVDASKRITVTDKLIEL